MMKFQLGAYSGLDTRLPRKQVGRGTETGALAAEGPTRNTDKLEFPLFFRRSNNFLWVPLFEILRQTGVFLCLGGRTTFGWLPYFETTPISKFQRGTVFCLASALLHRMVPVACDL